MTVVISGTNGIQNVLGSAAAPAESNTTSSNTGLYFPTSTTLGLSTAGTNAVYIDASQNVGIGTSSPSAKFDVVAATNNGIRVSDGTYTGTFVPSSLGGMAITTGGAYPLISYINGAERARIDSSGNLLLGTSTTYSSERLTVASGSTTQACITAINRNNTQTGGNIFASSVTAAGSGFYFYVGQSGNGTTVTTNNYFVYGNGNVQNTNNSYGAISDIKLKENVVDATPKLANMMQVRVVNYNLKSADGYETHKQIGVVAQELEQVFPGMVEETTDIDVEGNLLDTTTKSVKYSVFVPMLIKCIQEQQALITSLTARIEALEAR